jgi:hypothetical protein
LVLAGSLAARSDQPRLQANRQRKTADSSSALALGALDNIKAKLKAAFKKRGDKSKKTDEGAAASASAPAATTTAAATDATKTDTAAAAAPAEAPAGELPPRSELEELGTGLTRK